jgi:hypothetical protein
MPSPAQINEELDLELCEQAIADLLNAGVRFLIVGGWAVRFHGYEERIVEDLDLLVEFSAENWLRLMRALEAWGVTVPPFEELSQRTRPFRIRHDPVDILTAIGSVFPEPESSEVLLASSRARLAVASRLHHDPPAEVTFDEAWSESAKITLGRDLRVRVLSKAHLVLSKQHSGRPIDCDDVARLKARIGT